MNKKIIYLLMFIACEYAMNINATESKSVKSKLDNVTLFLQGAELTHNATASLSKGENEISIEGLSANIDQSSLKIKATGGVVISSYEYSVNFLTGENASPTVKKLQDSINTYQKQLQQIETDIKINDQLLKLLQNGTEKNVSGSKNGMPFDELVKTMDYYKTKTKELENAAVTNKEKREKCNTALSKLNLQLQQESEKNNKASGVLKITLNAPTAGSSNFTINYYTESAAWEPYYDINISSTDKPVKLTSKAKIRQVTGINWNNVKLTLSTATPTNGKIAPLFNTWFLKYREPIMIRGNMAATQNAYSYAKKEAAGVDNGEVLEDVAEVPLKSVMIKGVPAPQTLFDDYITINDNQINVSYAIDLPYTIPGNGKEQNIDIRTQDITATYKYYCAPKLDNETYLLAEIENPEKLNIISGIANITYEGTYIGETYIDASSTMENLALTLGTDKRVSVKREKMQDYSSKKTLGNSITQIFMYQITVKNNQNKPIKMTVKDQYPVSTQKEIEVELLKETTEPNTNKTETGVITWEEEFKAGETKTYKISYSVKYPKDKKLNL